MVTSERPEVLRAAVPIVIVVLVPVLILATLRAGRRPPPEPDPTSWKREVAEPWGSMALMVFFLFPVVLAVERAVDWPPLIPLLLGSIVLFAAYRFGAYSGVRRIKLVEAGIQLRVRWRNELIPWSDVMSVNYSELTDQTVVNTARGVALSLPPGPQGDAIGTAVASRIGQHWPIRVDAPAPTDADR
jgi:hypothetical protein